MPVDMELYKRLGVKATATLAQIKTAHRKKVKTLHPDVNKAPDAKEKFEAVQEAYDILSDQEKRARYDREGMLKAGPQQVPRDMVIRAMFRDIIVQIMKQMNNPSIQNPLQAWGEHYRQNKAVLNQLLTTNSADILKTKAVLERVQFNGGEGEENNFAQILSTQLSQFEAQKPDLLSKLQDLEDMNSVAQKYTYRVDQREMPQMQVFHLGPNTMFSGNFTRGANGAG